MGCPVTIINSLNDNWNYPLAVTQNGALHASSLLPWGREKVLREFRERKNGVELLQFGENVVLGLGVLNFCTPTGMRVELSQEIPTFLSFSVAAISD